MKKKIIAIAAVVLIVVLVCSLAACNSKSMFDGKYTKEASKEQAQSSWSSARVALGAESESVATVASDESEGLVKGWNGIKFTAYADSTSSYTYNGSTSEYTQKTNAEGSFLFDESAMAISGNTYYKSVRGETSKEQSLTAGIYLKDEVFYTGLTIDDYSLKLQLPVDTEDLGVGLIQVAFEELSEEFSQIAYYSVCSIFQEFDYDELAEFGIKAYINDSGDYNRVKFVFSNEMVEKLYASGEYEDFQTAAEFGDCSIIVVTDKATGSFQGAKISLVFSYESEEFSISMNNTASVENCAEIKSYPSDLKEYKNAQDLTEKDIEELFKNLVW